MAGHLACIFTRVAVSLACVVLGAAATPAAPVLMVRTASLVAALPLLRLLQAGQFIGARADFVPDQICRKLCLLQDQVPPMSPARAKQVRAAPPAKQQHGVASG
jgi:hypothetical protein